MPGSSPPEPDDPAKVAWPSGIEPRTWKYITRRTVHEFIDDGAMDAAGALTFFAVLSVFPAALAIVSLIGVIGDGEKIVNRLLSLLDQIAPTAVVDVLRQPLNDIAGPRLRASPSSWELWQRCGLRRRTSARSVGH